MNRSMWLGSESSWLDALQGLKFGRDNSSRMEEITKAYAEPYPEEHDELAEPEFNSYLLQLEGTVAVLNITGSMVTEDAWWNQYSGLVSYPEISRALVEVVEAKEAGLVTSMVMNMDTGGGSVAGLETATATLNWAISSGLEVYSHVTGMAFSAGYWFAAPSKKITITKMSEAGSIGVLITLFSMNAYLSKEGINYTIIRAGKYKALAHPAEETSESAILEAEGKAAQLYDFFLDHCSEYRKSLTIATKDAWAEGKTFFGQEAISVGLVDGFSTLSALVDDLLVVAEANAENSNTLSTEVVDMPARKKKAVVLKSDRAKAVLEVGGTEAEAKKVDAEEILASEEPAIEAEAKKADAEDTSAEALPAVSLEEPAEDTELVAYLKVENSKLTTQLSEALASAATAEASLATAVADQSGLVSIAMTSMQRMQVALSATPIDLEGLPAATIVTQHEKVRSAFLEKFNSGQVSASATTSQIENEEAASSNMPHGIVRKSS